MSFERNSSAWHGMLLLCTLFVAACGTPNAQIEWVNFVRFNGITYQATFDATRILPAHLLGPVFATVRFELSGHVSDPDYHTKDGDAAYLAPGTKVYSVLGYAATFRLAAYFPDGNLTIYDVSTNPKATTGQDLLDINGKVTAISLNSYQDGVTPLVTVSAPAAVQRLVQLILTAPVEQNLPAETITPTFVDFHLRDGTHAIRAFWNDTGILDFGIQTPPAFRQAIAQLVSQEPPTTPMPTTVPKKPAG